MKEKLTRRLNQKIISPLLKPNVLGPVLFLIFFSAVFSPALFLEKTGTAFLPFVVGVLSALLYFHAPPFLWLLSALCFSVCYGELFSPFSFFPESLKRFHLFFLIAGGFFVFSRLRPWLISFPVFKILKKSLSNIKISEIQTSCQMERELFSDRPNFKVLLSQAFPSLTREEKAFLQKHTTRLCEIAGEWETVKHKDISNSVQKFLKENKFLGLIIPKKYKGLGFSPTAHSRVLTHIARCNIPVSIFTMVPNSLGPARLILKYGTEEQKNHWLPLLACGEEIPCFGLTEVQAGSDMGAVTSEGIVFKDEDGKLKIQITFNKRYVSLSAMATVLGVAFRLKDPNGFLDGKTGPAFALIPSDTPGVERGLHHDPMGFPFYNGPIKGRVTVSEDALIGGFSQVHKGRAMLRECLSEGRGISIPSLSLGISQRVAQAVSLYSAVREQFGRPIGEFEGVREPLARMAGQTCLITATQDFTLSALNQGVSPPLLSALTKYNVTELTGQIVKDGMNVMGGAGLSLGPKNLTAMAYQSLPLAFTVEGANILTRSFMIFGQGCFQAHPFLLKEAEALKKNSLSDFDRVFSKHIYHFLCNFIRLAVLSLFRGYVYLFPAGIGKGHRAVQKLAWSASLFRFLTDTAFFSFGSRLMKREALSGRFADILSHQYMATALLWSREKRGGLKNSLPATEWGLEFCFYQIQKAFEGLLLNFNKPILFPFHRLLYLLLRLNPVGSPPSDKLSDTAAETLLKDRGFREKWLSHRPTNPEHPLYRLERAYELIEKSRGTAEKIQKAVKKNQLTQKTIPLLLDEALKKALITPEEREDFKKAESARWEAIQVDAFTREEYLR